MPSKFDEYLNKGGFTDQDKEAAQVRETEHVERNDAPTSVADSSQARPDDPQSQMSDDTKGHIQEVSDGQGNNHEIQSGSEPITPEAKAQADAALETHEEAPEEPKQGVEAEYPSSAEKGENEAETVGGGASDGVGSMEEEER